jgi:hypothetical protein
MGAAQHPQNVPVSEIVEVAADFHAFNTCNVTNMLNLPHRII